MWDDGLFAENNVFECNYDGGDCCQETCTPFVDVLANTTTSCEGPYDGCTDPEVLQGQNLCTNTPEEEEYIRDLTLQADLFTLLSDASCTSNLAECVTDKYTGDGAPVSSECGVDCILPFFQCVNAACSEECSATSTQANCTACISIELPLAIETKGAECSRELFKCGIGVACKAPWQYGDGLCWNGNNVDTCLYDGGDCCLSTCVSNSDACSLGALECVDPGVEQPPHCTNPFEREFLTSPARYAAFKTAVDSCNEFTVESEQLSCVTEQLEAAEDLASISLGCIENCVAMYAICCMSKCPM